MKQILLFFVAVMISASSFGQATDLFFSEYIEGSSSNKFLEIYNGTGAPVDLTDYEVLLFANGNADENDPNYNATLTGTLNNGEVYVIANSGVAEGLYSGTVNLESTVTYFNGDDAVVLKKISTNAYVDIFGRIGEDPGNYWEDGSVKTQNTTLVRKASVTSGITTNPTSGFPTLAAEWNAFNTDDVSNLGSHTMSTTVGTIQLTSPNGGETYNAGENVTITWTSSEVTNIMIEVYSIDGWGAIVNSASAAAGTLDFTIPANAWNWDGYKLRISDVDNTSVIDESDATFSIVGHDTEVFYHEFDGSTFGSFVTSNQLGDQVWVADNGPFAEMNGYSGGAVDNEDWLISPVINLENSKDEILEFNAYYDYNGPDLQLYSTSDFTGDVTTSTWTELPFTKPSSKSTWEPILVDISNLSDDIYIAFKYTSNTTDGAADWRINEVYVSGFIDESTNIPTTTKSSAIFPNPFDTQITITANEIASIEVLNTVGQSVTQTSGNNRSKVIVPTSHLAKGIYIIKVTESNGNIITQKVIKK